MENDIAFKVIVKNDGISDIIFKTLMLKGEAGGTISSIEKTSSVGVVDTYTITLNDGNTSTFEVTNGSNIASIEKTATAGLIDTYTVTLTNGDTSTFEVKNGEDAQLYELPQDCVVGYDKEPTQVTETSYERYIQIDDVNGISSVKYNGITLQETNDGRNLLEMWSYSGISYNPSIGSTVTFTKDSTNKFTDNGDGTFTLDFVNAYATSDVIVDISSVSSLYIKFSFASSSGFRFTRGFLNANNEVLTAYNYTDTSGTVNGTLTIPSGAKYFYIAFRSNNADVSVTITNPQLEVGSQATPYQPYCGGVPAPNPDYPKEIIGVGEKQQDNTYSVDLVAEDADGNVYTVTASGLSHPVYDGDWIDLVAGVLHRSTGYKVLDGSESWGEYPSYNGYYMTISDMRTGSRMDGKSNRFLTSVSSEHINNTIWYGILNNNIYMIEINISGVTDLASWETWLSNNPTYIVYPLATPTEESITLTGDLEQVKRIRGEYAYIDAPLRTGSTEITFGQDTDFPDGYEEVGLPIDDLLYYQDQEYIEFPKNWGFAMGYVFDANEVRFMINVTKDLHDNFRVVANKSIDLALSIYTGSGGGGLTGFNFVEGSFIKEYGQIQLRLKTENAHGLTVGSLLGARVSQGRLRITFEEVQS